LADAEPIPPHPVHACGSFPEPHDEVPRKANAAEQVGVGQQCGGEHPGVETVVLASRVGEAVAEAVCLAGVDGVDLKASLEKGGDDGPVRSFESDGNRISCALGLLADPADHVGKAGSGVGEHALSAGLSSGVHQKDVVGGLAPVNTSEPLESGGHGGRSFESELGEGLTRPRHAPSPILALDRRRLFTTGRPSRPSVGVRVLSRC